MLRKAINPDRRGQHLVLLFALRQLRDESLKPFFYQLAQRQGPVEQVHAILGLAEIDESGHVDPWLISQLDSPQARQTAITNALEMDLLGDEQIREMVAWTDLEPYPRVVLLAELVSRGEKIDPGILEPLAEHPMITVAGIATYLLVRQGNDSTVSTYQKRASALAARRRDEHLLDMFGAIDRYELTEAKDWLVSVVADGELDPIVQLTALAVLLAIDPTSGVEAWQRLTDEAQSETRRLRLALVLLQASTKVPANTFDELAEEEDTLLSRMGRAGRAVAAGGEASAALNALIDLGHRSTANWSLAAAQGLSHDDAARVYVHLISNVKGNRRGRDERAELAMLAAAQLVELDPTLLEQQLVDTPDDSLTQEAILMGLFDTRSTLLGAMIDKVDRVGFGRADSLVLILLAKHSDAVEADDLHDLGIVASGGGQVSPVLQTQASWLYLKHRNVTEQALAEIFATD